MQRIAVDMDGVLADVYENFFRLDEQEFGRRKTAEEVDGKPEFEAFPHSRKYVFQENFFRTAPVIAGSQEVLQELSKQYEIYIVSAAMEFPQSLSEKKEWLATHFPFISWQQVVFCGSKKIVNADIMIDDHFKNLDHFEGTTFLYSQPHNIRLQQGRHKRVHSWQEIADILL